MNYGKQQTEEYHSLVKNPLNKKIHSIFIDPTKQEIKELSKEMNVARFISFDNHFYLFDGSLLHSDAINHLKLPIYTDNPSIKKVFLGICKPNTNGTLTYLDSNQIKPTTETLEKINIFHSHIDKYFK